MSRIDAWGVRLFLLLVGMMSIVLLAPRAALADTQVSANITTNTTWTAAGSPYVLTKSVTVSSGVTLSIQPGVTIEFDAGTTGELYVAGAVSAVGTAGSPIIFTSYQAASGGGAPGQYMGVYVAGISSLPSQFSNVNFRYGGYGSGGYYAYGELAVASGSVSVDHGDFEHNQYSGVKVGTGTASADVSHSTFANNGDGTSVLGGNAVLTLNDSTITNSTQDGMFFNISSTTAAGSSVTASDITQNGRFGIYLGEPCSNPVSTFPHGERNNIYDNGASATASNGLELNTLYTCHALPVDWKNNYWGPAQIDKGEVYLICLAGGPPGLTYGEDPAQPGGWLANGFGKRSGDSASYPTPGPVSIAEGPPVDTGKNKCGVETYSRTVYNAFLVAPGDFQQAFMPNHVPVPASADLYGDASTGPDGGLESSPNLVKPACGDPVECATGNYYETDTDLAIPGLNGGLAFARTYNSQAAASATTPGPLGFGWSFRFGDVLSVDPNSGNAVVTGAAGNTVRFYANADGSYWAPPWVQATLTKNQDATFTYALPDHRSEGLDGSGRLVWEQDANGNRTTLAYSNGHVSSITDASGRALSFGYNAGGEISQIIDPAGRQVTYGYDGSGNLTSVTNVGGKTTSYFYDGSHQLTQASYPRGGKLTNAYDTSGRVMSQTDPDGGKTTWSYGNNETMITDPAGVVTDEKFSNSLPVSITRGDGSPGASTTTIAYDANLNPTTITDPNTHESDYGYDGQNNVTSITDALGHTTTRTFNGDRDLTSVTLPSGKQTTFGYDGHDNLTSVRQTLTETAQTPTTTMAYDAKGELTKVTDPLNHSSTYGYDTYGDRTSATSPLGHKTTWTYDQLGGETAVTTARGNEAGANPAAFTTTTSLDAFERPWQTSDPSGKHATFSYDDDGNLSDSTDRDGHNTHIDYTLADRPSQVTRGDGSVLKTAYYPDGSLKSQTDGLGHTTSYSYDSHGRLQQTTDPLGRQTTSAYDAAGNQTKITDAAGHTTTTGYDNANRLTSVSYSTGNPAPVSYAYNTDGLPTSITDSTGTSSYSYDSLDRVTSETSGAGQTTGYGHDLAGQLTSITYPSALTSLDLGGPGAQQQIPTGTVTRTYDQDGNLQSVKDWLGHTTTFGYSPEQQLTSITRPNATSATYAYNADGALADLTDLGAHTSDTRSTEGLLTGVTPDSGSAQTFGYDGAQRLTSGSYQYNAADDLTQTSIARGPAITQSFDAGSQLQSTSQSGATTNTFGYDQLGERNSQTPATGPATSNTYDQAGQLIAYAGPDHTSTTGATVSDQYTYDATGVRQTKTTNNQLTNEAWDLAGGLPLMIEDGPTAYITGPNSLPIEQIAQDGTVSYYSQDQQGSTTNLTNSSGTTIATHTYDPYGNPTTSTGPATPFGYAGQYTDAETGLQYDRARYYDPTTGQFLTPDPLTATTRQPYAYANNDPTNLNDPTGLCLIDIACGLQNTIGHAATTGAQALGNTAAGLADGATGGLSTHLLNDIGIHPNTCSVLFNAAKPAGLLGGVLIPGLGEEDLAATAAEDTATIWPGSAGEMDSLLGLEGRRVPDGPTTPGRGKVVWQANQATKITFEQHPYHPDAPVFHRGPHWHLDTPGASHQTYTPGDPIPGY